MIAGIKVLSDLASYIFRLINRTDLENLLYRTNIDPDYWYIVALVAPNIDPEHSLAHLFVVVFDTLDPLHQQLLRCGLLRFRP